MINFLGFLCMLIGEVFWIPRTDQKIEHSTGFFFFPLSFFLKKKAPYISVGSRLLLFTHKLIKSTFFLLKTKFACNRNKFNLIQFMYIVGCFWTVNGRRPFGIIKKYRLLPFFVLCFYFGTDLCISILSGFIF